MGSIYKRGNIYWLKYYRDGKPIRESSKSDREADARRLLRKREGEIAEGKRPGVYFDRVRFDELAEALLTDYVVNRRKSLDRAQLSVNGHLAPFFSGMRVANITTPVINDYIVHRLKEGAANASINRELSALKRMFTLAMRSTPPRVGHVPYIPMLAENNTRKGFFEHDEFIALRDILPEYLQNLVGFAYLTGWRRREITSLTWDRVDLEQGTVRLEAEDSKNQEARTLYINGEILSLLKAQFRERHLGCRFVFHRQGNQIKSLQKAWRTACRKTGLEGKLFHDLRRTAVRNMVRAGVPERVAMTISGHKTRAVFERYNIVSPQDLLDATTKIDNYHRRNTKVEPGTQQAHHGHKNGHT
ncbi:MAG: tyrosine-type recombinase/integrase [Deltaproteobacteria bacterium]|nr:tyrosine-type recombinase/integrase [Deltaproteobacteria bacterium]